MPSKDSDQLEYKRSQIRIFIRHILDSQCFQSFFMYNKIDQTTQMHRLIRVFIVYMSEGMFSHMAAHLLTLKATRKSASENVVCLCRLLHLLANFSNLHFAYRQTVWTQIRLLLKEQSDLGPHCLQQWLKITGRRQSRRQLLWLAF